MGGLALLVRGLHGAFLFVVIIYKFRVQVLGDGRRGVGKCGGVSGGSDGICTVGALIDRAEKVLFRPSSLGGFVRGFLGKCLQLSVDVDDDDEKEGTMETTDEEGETPHKPSKKQKNKPDNFVLPPDSEQGTGGTPRPPIPPSIPPGGKDKEGDSPQ